MRTSSQLVHWWVSRSGRSIAGSHLLTSQLDELCLLFRFEGAGLMAADPRRRHGAVATATAVLRAPAASGVPCTTDSANDPAEKSACVSGSRCASGPVRCPLRTAEQARASLFFQATKSQRWMPWRQEPMKDVSDCEKLRGTVY